MPIEWGNDSQLVFGFVFPLTVLVFTTMLHHILHRSGLHWLLWRGENSAQQQYDLRTKISRPGMAAVLRADQLAAQLLSPSEYLHALNPQRLLNEMTRFQQSSCEEIVDDLMTTTHPALWAALPNPLKQGYYRHGAQYLRPFLDDVLDDLVEHADHLFDFHQTVRDHIYRDHFDESPTLIRCLTHQRLTYMNLHARRYQYCIAVAFALSLVSVALLSNFHSLATPLSTSALLCVSLMIALIALNGVNLLLIHRATPQSIQHAIRHAIQAPTQQFAGQSARAISKSLTQHLLNINAQLHSLETGSKRHVLENIISRRFRQWFLDTLPGHIRLLTPFNKISSNISSKISSNKNTNTSSRQRFCHIASIQLIQAMTRPFADTEYRTHCETDVEQRIVNKLLHFSSVQFDALLKTYTTLYTQGWRLASAVIALATVIILAITF